MKNFTKVRLLGLLINLFTFIVPIVVVITTYFKITDSPRVLWNFVGIILLAIILLSWFRSAKKKIEIRRKQGFYNSPYKILIVYKAMPLVFLVLFTWFLGSVGTDIETLFYVMLVITVSVFIGFGFNLLQVRYDKKLIKDIKRDELNE